jgi:hypothetical protein
MKTRKYFISVFTVLLSVLFLNSCKKDLDSGDNWAETKDVAIIADKSNPENGKQYLEIIYENIGNDAIRKIKYQLIERTGTKTDTVENTIIPETVFMPKEKHLVPRHIGEEPATFDDVKIGKIWVVKDGK